MVEIESSNALFFRTNTTCNNLLRELQQIWVEIGENETDKDKMLMELERECLQIYQRKVDEATNSKAKLHQSVAVIEAEIASLMAALGVLSINSPIKPDKASKSLKEKLAALTLLLEDLRIQKEERMKQFSDIKTQIEKINGEICDHLNKDMIGSSNFEEQDLTLRKLNEYQTHLHKLQMKKSDRLNKVLSYVNEVHELCGVLGVEFTQTVCEIHPSLERTNQSTNISDSTLEGLEHMIQKLKTERRDRFRKLKAIVTSLYELWNLMDTPEEERTKFGRVTYVVRSSESNITEPNILSTETIEQLSAEVDSLSKLKASRMKELVMKRRSELENLCILTHIQPDEPIKPFAEKSTALIDSGLVDPSEFLANIEMRINKIKDEARSRKDIMDRIDRWLSACEEENWLEEYNLDENRYSAGRGGHVNLKRAERARVIVNKIPAMVDNLIKKTLLWEEETHKTFLYDGVRLVNILEDYKLTRKQQEEEKKRYQDSKKRQDLLLTQRESIYGSKPSPRRSNSFRKSIGSVPPTPRRSSATSELLLTPRSYSGHHRHRQKEDTVSTSYTSIYSSEPDSPLQG